MWRKRVTHSSVAAALWEQRKVNFQRNLDVLNMKRYSGADDQLTLVCVSACLPAFTSFSFDFGDWLLAADCSVFLRLSTWKASVIIATTAGPLYPPVLKSCPTTIRGRSHWSNIWQELFSATGQWSKRAFSIASVVATATCSSNGNFLAIMQSYSADSGADDRAYTRPSGLMLVQSSEKTKEIDRRRDRERKVRAKWRTSE